MTRCPAILGGQPVFERPLHVGSPNVGSREVLWNRINGALDRRWLTNNGNLAQEFESRICEITGVKHCIAVSNATVGLELAARALGLTGQVIVPSFTFIATVHALQWLGLRPVFCDVDPTTHNIDPRHAASLITPETSGVIGTHLWGRPCPVEELQQLAERQGLKLLFDAAHAFGCSHDAQMIGNFGDAEVFSFHATKFVNSAEGGAITTNNDSLADVLRCMRNFGFSGYDRVSMLGCNGKMSELSAAMGLTSLDSMEEFRKINRRNYDEYQSRIEDIPGLRLERYDQYKHHNYQYIVILVDADLFGMSRDELVTALHAENVLARRYFRPGCHLQEPYRTQQPNANQSLPFTNALSEKALQLPTGSAVAPDDIQIVCELISQLKSRAREIRTALAARAG